MTYDIEAVVLQRYEEGARQPQKTLCCPTSYEQKYLSFTGGNHRQGLRLRQSHSLRVRGGKRPRSRVGCGEKLDLDKVHN
ncbi:MAG: hypothetical protein N5P05_000622 [Chroococcopsis gigantea SAG 12.99]|jgi:hypothetical protein|nr:hypothetical protein [Chroococcopsis gigantea SAG 12.99]